MIEVVPDFRRQVCRPNRGGCGKHASEVGPISWNGLCLACSTAHVAENVIGLANHQGAPLRRWRLGMAASIGAVLLDEPPTDVHTGGHG